MGQPGSVYVLLNPSMPGMVKVGFTKHEPERRARELRTTGVPERFVVLWHEYVSDAEAVEAKVHEELEGHRVDRRREFFRVAPKVAIAAVMNAADGMRITSPAAGDFVEVLNRLRDVHGSLIRSDLVSACVLITKDSVVLRTTAGTAGPGETQLTDSDLEVIWGEEGSWFSLEATARENADRLLEFDEYTLLMTTDLISPAEGERLDRLHNPWRQSPPS